VRRIEAGVEQEDHPPARADRARRAGLSQERSGEGEASRHNIEQRQARAARAPSGCGCGNAASSAQNISELNATRWRVCRRIMCRRMGSATAAIPPEKADRADS